MHRLANAMALVAVLLVTAGCAVIGNPEPSREPDVTPAMPDVVLSPTTDSQQLTNEQLSELASGPVSAAVHTLTVHGYDVTVVAGDSRVLTQGEWDYLAVLNIAVDGFAARVTAG